MPDKTRIDKWLWAVRIYKSRTLASNACKANSIKINEANAKPATDVSIGDIVGVKKGGFNLSFKVEKIIEKRVGAPLAVLCYDHITPADELNKYKDWYAGKAQAEVREKGSGRPTKKERREISDYKDHFYEFDLFDED